MESTEKDNSEEEEETSEIVNNAEYVNASPPMSLTGITWPLSPCEEGQHVNHEHQQNDPILICGVC